MIKQEKEVRISIDAGDQGSVGLEPSRSIPLSQVEEFKDSGSSERKDAESDKEQISQENEENEEDEDSDDSFKSCDPDQESPQEESKEEVK